ncbi:hypothetical protein F5884DRAFT_849097 [Xylogone sp. PMI_703]|nr:hypothetical protein F5884DRAFT_849097 [Xylogone sp. PMI_703]
MAAIMAAASSWYVHSYTLVRKMCEVKTRTNKLDLDDLSSMIREVRRVVVEREPSGSTAWAITYRKEQDPAPKKRVWQNFKFFGRRRFYWAFVLAFRSSTE